MDMAHACDCGVAFKLSLLCDNPVYITADRLSTTSLNIVVVPATVAEQCLSLGTVRVLDKVPLRSTLCCKAWSERPSYTIASGAFPMWQVPVPEKKPYRPVRLEVDSRLKSPAEMQIPPDESDSGGAR